MVGNDRAFLGESLDMIGFFLQETQGNEQREIGIFDTCILEHVIQYPHDVFPQSISPWLDDHTPPDRGFLRHVRCLDHLLIPFRIVFHPCRRNCCFFLFCHTYPFCRIKLLSSSLRCLGGTALCLFLRWNAGYLVKQNGYQFLLRKSFYHLTMSE